MPLIRKDAGKTAPPTNPLAELTSTNNDARFNAARQLAKDPSSVKALGGALASETDARVREALFTSLAHIRTPEAIAVVLPHIRSDDAGIRASALDALNAMPEAVENSLPALLADPDSDVRLLVCDVVRRLPGPRATQYLCDLLRHETHLNVCGAAVDALSEVGDESALPVLAKCAERFAFEPFLVFSIKTAANRITGDGRPSGPQVT
jgi:HEAT repeat protein